MPERALAVPFAHEQQCRRDWWFSINATISRPPQADVASRPIRINSDLPGGCSFDQDEFRSGGLEGAGELARELVVGAW
jgi:hypothetical protein